MTEAAACYTWSVFLGGIERKVTETPKGQGHSGYPQVFLICGEITPKLARLINERMAGSPAKNIKMCGWFSKKRLYQKINRLPLILPGPLKSSQNHESKDAVTPVSMGRVCGIHTP